MGEQTNANNNYLFWTQFDWHESDICSFVWSTSFYFPLPLNKFLFLHFKLARWDCYHFVTLPFLFTTRHYGTKDNKHFKASAENLLHLPKKVQQYKTVQSLKTDNTHFLCEMIYLIFLWAPRSLHHCHTFAFSCTLSRRFVKILSSCCSGNLSLMHNALVLILHVRSTIFSFSYLQQFICKFISICIIKYVCVHYCIFLSKIR